jgi:hypothetical protein
MTLKEKFESSDLLISRPKRVLKQIKIADEFAIGFAEWFTNEQSPYSIVSGNQEERFSDFRKKYTAKELLQIYKTEKGL